MGRIGGDAELSVRGRTYAAALARYFNNENRLEGLRVWTSELKRTHQTAQGIKAPIEPVPFLNELYAVSTHFIYLCYINSYVKCLILLLGCMRRIEL